MPSSRSLSHLRNLLQIWMFFFLALGVFFLFYGNNLLEQLNLVSQKLNLPLELLPVSQDNFWLASSLSSIVVLVFLCYWGQKNIRENIVSVEVMLLSKFTSTFFFFYFFVSNVKALAYLLGMGIDGLIFLSTYYFYQKAKKDYGV